MMRYAPKLGLAAAGLVALAGIAAAQQIESVRWTMSDRKIQGWVGPLSDNGYTGFVSEIDEAGRLVTYLPARQEIRDMKAEIDIESSETLVPPPQVASVSSGHVHIDRVKYYDSSGSAVVPEGTQDYEVVVPRDLLRALDRDRTYQVQVQHGGQKWRLNWSFRVYPGPYELSRLRCARHQDPARQRGKIRFRVELKEPVKNPRGELYGFTVNPNEPFDLARVPRTPDQPALSTLYKALIPFGEQAVNLALPVADKGFSGNVSIMVNHMYGGWEIGADRYGPAYKAAVKDGFMLQNGMEHYRECTIAVAGRAQSVVPSTGTKRKIKRKTK